METIRLGLQPIIGYSICDVILADEPRFFKNTQVDIEKLLDYKISSILRKGKFLIWEFTKEFSKIYALNHLGMSGIWYILSSFSVDELGQGEYKHFKLYFRLVLKNDILHLIFVNTRKFGTFHIKQLDDILKQKSIASLGPDILDQPFKIDEFLLRFKGRKKEIGKALLDSSIISGCGNIYKCESLFRAGINPFTPSNKIPEKSLRLLAIKLSDVAHEAMRHKGSTLRDFKNVDGYAGLMQNTFQVYDRKDLPCIECAEPILAEKQGDRTSYYCPKCQLL
ncbi:MAG: bifunctional DNA-formamidopyrimidine glycosylase/DNA-(apurinic or apyrimidinic site) lyase [Candidatus Heimdallarchaeota archaeon]|nr:bifunctional DNA-formamidopyrimidine glycosylase/DNA-(apurinic or apyrimidinic site) lyase [Candidatus Heimdallarchaeota archaeon]